MKPVAFDINKEARKVLQEAPKKPPEQVWQVKCHSGGLFLRRVNGAVSNLLLATYAT